VLKNMVAVGGGGCDDRIVYSTSDNLLHRDYKGSMNRGVHWLREIEQKLPDIVVLAASAHIWDVNHTVVAHVGVPYSDERQDSIFKGTFLEVAGLSKAMPKDLIRRYTAANKSRPILFWKTNQPGGCTPTIVRWNPCFTGTNAPNSNDYQGSRFMDRDDWVVAQAAMPIIDLRMLHWRKDAHPNSQGAYPDTADCLHFNLKTAVLSSTFPRMLLHSLLIHDPSAMARARSEHPQKNQKNGGLQNGEALDVSQKKERKKKEAAALRTATQSSLLVPGANVLP